MKKYIGTKQIEAEPMTMGEAYERGLLQAGKLPKDVEKNNAGYHIRYKDGYESWSPVEPFEKAYRVADTPLERMLIEGEDLTIKTEKLRLFIKSGRFDMFDIPIKALLQAQLRTMVDYQCLLNMRYAKMENGNKHGFHHFPFSIALHLLKDGYKVRRHGWGKYFRISNCSNILFMDYDRDLSDFWLPSNDDIFAEDWEIFVSEEENQEK